MNVVVDEYTAGPVFFASSVSSRGGHEWVIEFQKEPPDLQAFAIQLDQNLQKINSDYEAKRFRDLALAPLLLRSVPRGTFLRWMKERGKLGGQSKVPRLANHRDYIEAVLRLVD